MLVLKDKLIFRWQSLSFLLVCGRLLLIKYGPCVFYLLIYLLIDTSNSILSL